MSDNSDMENLAGTSPESDELPWGPRCSRAGCVAHGCISYDGGQRWWCADDDPGAEKREAALRKAIEERAKRTVPWDPEGVAGGFAP